MRDLTYPPIILAAKAGFRALGQKITITVPNDDLRLSGV